MFILSFDVYWKF